MGRIFIIGSVGLVPQIGYDWLHRTDPAELRGVWLTVLFAA